jgi:protease-4
MAESTQNRRERGAPRRSATMVLVTLTLVGLLIFAGSVGLVWWLVQRGSQADVHAGSTLLVSLDGGLPEAPPAGGLLFDPQDAPPLATEYARAIRAAASDERINGLVLELDGLSAGWGSLRELRDAIAAFRAADKTCVAWSTAYDTKAYYLASACDKVVLAPGGLALVNGLQVSVTYYAGTFEKLGVVADFEHVGEFKSGPEPYVRSGPSDEAVVAYEEMLGSLWDEFRVQVAASRGWEPATLDALVDHPTLSPEDALAAKLVDALAFQDAVRVRAGAPLDDAWLASLQAPVTAEDREGIDDRLTTGREYVKDLRNKDSRGGDQIAVVYAEGQMLPGEDSGGLFGSDALTDGAFRSWMRAVRDDDSVKAVVIRINSPGGSGLAADNMWREVELVKGAGKPVVVSMANYAASGGYYIAAPADWIVAQPNTLTGSIGVFGGKLALQGTLEKVGMTEHHFQRGALAGLFSATEPFSDDGREVFRAFLSDFYDQFTERVAAGRKLDVPTVHDVARGRVWTGQQALDRKLVDQLGGLDVALAKAAELAQLEEYGIETFPARKTFFEVLMEDLEQSSAPRLEVQLPVPEAVDAGLREARRLEAMLGSGGVAAYLAGDVRVE